MGILTPIDRSERPAPVEVYNWRVYVLALSAAMASAMFGYDSAFIGGTLSLASFRRDFGVTTATATALSSQIVSTFQGGCFFGALFVYPLLIKYGRKIGLLLAGVIFSVGAIVQTCAPSGGLGYIYAGRALTGLGVGSSSLIVPLYISEWSPPALRGRLIGMFEILLQFFLVVGFWINYGVNQTLPSTSTQWHITFGFQLVPSGLLIIAMLFQPESPRFLLEKGRDEQARKVLSRIRNLPADHPYIDYEITMVKNQLESESKITHGDRSIGAKIKVIGQPSNLKRLLFGIALMFFQNFSGINALNYYSPTIVRSIGFTGTSTSLLATGIFGLIKAFATLIFMVVGIDRLGRRRAIFIGSAGAAFALYYIAIYSSVSGSFNAPPTRDGGAYFALISIYLFAVFYAFSWNGIPWIFCAEVFPTGIRSLCLVVTTMSQWLAQFIIAYSFPYMIRDMRWGVFVLFGTATVVGACFYWWFIPETSQISLEDMDLLFSQPGRASEKRKRTLELLDNARGMPQSEYAEKLQSTHMEKLEKSESA